jgi:hypothetical protein
LLGRTWESLKESNIKNGFRATGIFDPDCNNQQRVNKNNYSTSLFNPEKLKRYLELKTLKVNTDRQDDISTSHTEAQSEISLPHTGQGASPILNTFEEILLENMKTQKVPPTVKTGKKKIAGTGQLLTSKDAINKKRALEETTISKKKSKRLKKVSSSSSDGVDDIPEYSSESADDISDENLNPSSDDNCDVVKPGDYVLVQFPTKKTVRYYVGQIIVANITSEYRIKFLRCKNKAQGIFKWPLVDDELDIEQDKCIKKLKPPYCRRGLLCFNTDFTGYNIS